MSMLCNGSMQDDDDHIIGKGTSMKINLMNSPNTWKDEDAFPAFKTSRKNENKEI